MTTPDDSGIGEPWADYRKPRWWRLRQLFLAAQDYGESLIVLRRGEYAASLVRAKKARDEFYRQQSAVAIGMSILPSAG